VDITYGNQMEVPACPDPAHAGSVKVRAGWYGRAGQRRQRWWCVPAGGGRHRFTEVLPRLAGGGAGTCLECATELEPWEGQPAPRLYGFSVRAVAGALARVAAGASYRSVAAAVRAGAGRARPVPARQRGKKWYDPNRHGQLVADWVEVFAPVIWEACAARALASWPARLVLDERGFRGPHTTANRRGEQLFSVLGAVGYPRAGARPLIWRLEAVPDAAAVAWQKFLTAVPGRPELLVTDGGPAVLHAIAATWPGDPAPVLRRCEWHLLRALTQTLPEQVRNDPAHPLTTALPGCLASTANWAAFEKILHRHARHGGLHATWAWAHRHRDLILAQAASRDRSGPRSTGALEDLYRHLDNILGDRVYQMTNKTRADRLLMLIAADRNGWASERDWADIIRRHLHHCAGLAAHQRQVTDSATHPSLR